MELIHNCLTLTVEAESTKEIALSNWLNHAHYIYAIDHERNAILVFNLPNWLISHLTENGNLKKARIRHGTMSNYSDMLTGSCLRISGHTAGLRRDRTTVPSPPFPKDMLYWTQHIFTTAIRHGGYATIFRDG